jgi:hypothetical protein
MARPVQYLNFGCTSAATFWLDVCVPSHSRYFAAPSRLSAIQAAWPTWHVHEWLWHAKHPGQDAHQTIPAYVKFRDGLIADCEELAWLRDVTDASKHGGLRRATKVAAVSGTGLHTTGQVFDVYGNHTASHSDPLQLVVDEVSHDFGDVLRTAIEYWQTEHFK